MGRLRAAAASPLRFHGPGCKPRCAAYHTLPAARARRRGGGGQPVAAHTAAGCPLRNKNTRQRSQPWPRLLLFCYNASGWARLSPQCAWAGVCQCRRLRPVPGGWTLACAWTWRRWHRCQYLCDILLVFVSEFAHRSLCAVLQVKDNESLYPAFYKLTDSRSQITSCAPPASHMEPALSGVRMPPFLQPSVRWRLPHEVHMLQTCLTWCAQPCRRSCWTTCSRCAARARWSRQKRLCSINRACSHPCIPVHVIQVKQLVTGAM